MSYQPTPYDEIEILLVMMGSLFLKGPEIDLTGLPKIVSRYFCIFGTLEFLKTQKYRRIHENRTEVGNSDRPTCTIACCIPSNTNSRPKATKKRFDYAFALPSSHLRPEVGIKSPERHEDEQNATKGRPIYECAL